MNVCVALKRLLFVSVMGLCCTQAVVADEGIGMVTGSATGTYVQFGKDIANTVKDSGVTIIVKESKGSIDNIKRLNSRENAALGIVQSDVLGFLTRSKSPEMQEISERLRLIFPFYNEEVHLFASRSIQTFQDLQGKRLIVGEEGSGNWLTSNNLLQMMDVIPSETLSMAPKDAAVAVLTGAADAMIYVAGKPVKLFTALGELREKPDFAPLFEKVHFVPLDNTLMLREYVASEIGPEDYSWVTEKTPTIAVKAVLMSFDFSSKRSGYFKQRCEELAKIGKAIRSNIGELRLNGHPKWKEVDLAAKVGTWQRDTCSQEAVGESKMDITKEMEKVLLNELWSKPYPAIASAQNFEVSAITDVAP